MNDINPLPYSALLRDIEADPQICAKFSAQDVAAYHVDDPFKAVKAAIHFKDRNRPEVAIAICQRVLEKFPKDVFALYESAINHVRLGQFVEASTFSRRAFARDPGSFERRILHADILAIIGDHMALAPFETADWAGSAQRNDLLLQRELAEYILHHPRETTVARYERDSDLFLAPDQVEKEIFEAVRQERPFALVRAADGEGAWAFQDMASEARYGRLFDANRREFLVDWFGDDALFDDADFYRFVRETLAMIGEADIIGVPALSWVEHEYRILSRRGIPSCLNILLALGLIGDAAPPSDKKYCSSHIHMNLEHDGFFDRLAAAGRKVGLITSFPGLADRLKAREFDVQIVHLVPGDSRNFWKDGAGRAQCQYPDRVREVMSALDKADLRNHIFLIASGFVGKRYCLKVRERGGIALDIGALANVWGGK